MKYLIILIAIANLSCIPNAELPSTNTQTIEICDISFKLPEKNIKYKGTYHQEGAGPLGPMDIDGEILLTLMSSKEWPMVAFYELKYTRAKVVDYKHDWHEVDPNDLPPLLKLPDFTFDRYGHTNSSYHIGQMPLSMVGDLWPLPNKPIKIGRSHTEKITSHPQDQEYDDMRYKGTREISFVNFKIFEGKKFLIIDVHTDIDVYFEKDNEPVKLIINSNIFWDTSLNLPFKVKQDILWRGTVEISESEVQDFTQILNLNMKRIEK